MTTEEIRTIESNIMKAAANYKDYEELLNQYKTVILYWNEFNEENAGQYSRSLEREIKGHKIAIKREDQEIEANTWDGYFEGDANRMSIEIKTEKIELIKRLIKII